MITILTVPLVFVPFAGAVLGSLLGLAAVLWVLIVDVIATRQTLGISTGKATITTLITAIVLIVISLAITFAFFPENFQVGRPLKGRSRHCRSPDQRDASREVRGHGRTHAVPGQFQDKLKAIET